MFEIHSFDKLSSTSDKIREYPAGTVVVAAEQTKGRGRFGREWVSDKGGLWFSVCLNPERKLFEYTFAISLAVLDALGIEAEIKWPNDIVVGGKKLCGILSESVFDGNTASKIIVGIGIDVNNNLPDSLINDAISLKDIIGKEIDLKSLLESILKKIEGAISLDSKDLIKKYKSRCGLLGKTIKAKSIDKELEGKALDIDEEGRLVLETKVGIVKLNEADVSVI